MRVTLLWLGIVCMGSTPLMAQGSAGPIRPRPQPPGTRASPERLPKEAREAFRYVPPSDPLLAKAIAANIDFDRDLPNFLCQERMTRWSSRNLGKKWKQDDVIEAEVLTVGNKTQYRDIKADGEATGADDFADIGGAWSVGEYGAVVINLFNPRSRTRFTKQGPAKLGDRETMVYDYKIEEEHSRWRIGAGGRTATPAHHGKVWIDTDSGRALRVETEPTYLPHDFPLASVVSVLEYDDVEIDGRSYLLPSRGENESCQRGSVFCARLEIEFLDYRKFSSESTLFTTDSDIEFGREVPEQTETTPSTDLPKKHAPVR